MQGLERTYRISYQGVSEASLPKQSVHTYNGIDASHPLTIQLLFTPGRRALNDSNAWWQHQKHMVRIDASIPNPRYLQSYVVASPHQSVLPVQCMSNEFVINRLACDKVMTSMYVMRPISLAATLAADSVRHFSQAVQNQYIHVNNAQWDTVLSPLTLPNLQNSVFMLALCTPISTTNRSPICMILSKTIVQRCMTRKFGSVCLHQFKQDGGNDTKIKVRQLVLCSFLGNYIHADPASRPCRAVRDILYNRLGGYTSSEATDKWFFKFFHLCSHVIVFALRDYLVEALHDNPSMSHHFNCLTNFNVGAESFSGVTMAAMDAVRRFLSENQFLLSQSDTSDELFIQLNQLILPFHQKLLNISYKRMNASIIFNLISCRKALPMVPMPGDGSIAAVQESDDLMDVADILELDLHQEESDIFDIRSYITAHQMSALRAVVERVAPLEFGLMTRCVSFFVCFGVEWSSVKYIFRLLQDIHEGNIGPTEQVYWLKKLVQQDPHAYTLLQVTAELLREAQGIRVASTLPMHHWVNQMDAVRTRFGLKGTPYCISSSMYFYFCSVCDTIYSLLVEFNSPYKQQYVYGLRGAVVEYSTDRCYCYRSVENHRGKCQDQPLQQVPLLGKILQFNNKYIMLCPQRGCGMPMVLNTLECMFTSRGPACAICTRAYRAKAEKPFSLRQKSLEFHCLRCGVGNKKKLTMVNSYLYPKGVVLCNVHHFAALQKYIEKMYNEDMRHEDVAKLILGFVAQWKKNHRERNNAYHKKP